MIDQNICHTLLTYTDDIAIWMNVSGRKRTSRRFVDYVRILCQSDKLSSYTKVSGLECSSEKRKIILFNNGPGPKELPQIKLDGTIKCNWKRHLETTLSKARKGLNLLKITIKNPGTIFLIYLAISLVTSKLT